MIDIEKREQKEQEKKKTRQRMQLTRVAKERKSGCMGFAETMIIEYNGKKKSRANRLSMSRLYSKGYSGDIGEDDEDDSLQDESESEYPVIE